MFEHIELRVPARESALTVVRLTTAGAAAQGCPDLEMLEDLKTAVCEACYALIRQHFAPEEIRIEYEAGEAFAARISACGARRETGNRPPDAALCRAVLTAMVPQVSVEEDERGICSIRLHG